MNDQDAVYRASRARELLDDPILKEAFDGMERDSNEGILRLDITDDERRMGVMAVLAVRHLKTRLSDIVNEARRTAEKAEEAKNPARRKIV